MCGSNQASERTGQVKWRMVAAAGDTGVQGKISVALVQEGNESDVQLSEI